MLIFIIVESIVQILIFFLFFGEFDSLKLNQNMNL